ncbi:hypothetical protein Back2_01320 [Nocardioides baekrokdamisoli]|uniref:DUF3046 domain-containing protein n=1 Tax=Nocardioides baekrokdamisoli TaxID=1804624 RepID=A0A3G9III3_9ACTN|nr:DUF3046 domain-containing protein [Nocardioides baekrokdamisoli]BBH15845.1 hypothetical protein Back2_01320 [Nocardioides baekrokdamisoli]
MRVTEFWSRMEEALGGAYAGVWASQHVIAELGGLTVQQALASGEQPKYVWRAVHETLGLPANQR